MYGEQVYSNWYSWGYVRDEAKSVDHNAPRCDERERARSCIKPYVCQTEEVGTFRMKNAMDE